MRREDGTRRLGLAIARGCGNAPARARMRRLLRESFRALRAAWPGLDLVVSCSRPWPGAGMADVAEELAALVATTLGKRG